MSDLPQTRKPDVVVFDLGKVLIDFDFSIAIERIARDADCGPEEISERMVRDPLLIQFETGTVTSREFFDEAVKRIGYRGSYLEFRAAFGDIFSPLEDMIAIQGYLKHKGVPTYLFSNTNEIAIEHVKKVFPFFSTFQSTILSFEHRAMKPDPSIYEVVESRTGRKGSAILYLDDLKENVAAGRDRGWQVIHHRSGMESIPILRDLGLPLPSA